MTDTEAEARKAYDKIMETLRALPWNVREDACFKLLHNREFCWDCGWETPDGRICQCSNDE